VGGGRGQLLKPGRQKRGGQKASSTSRFGELKKNDGSSVEEMGNEARKEKTSSSEKTVVPYHVAPMIKNRGGRQEALTDQKSDKKTTESISLLIWYKRQNLREDEVI